MIACGVVGDAKKDNADRLLHIGNEIEKLIKAYNPDVVSVEKVYFSKNKKTALSVAEARGVILYTARKLGVPVLEFTPTDVKSVVAGDGKSDKASLAKIVGITLGEKKYRRAG